MRRKKPSSDERTLQILAAFGIAAVLFVVVMSALPTPVPTTQLAQVTPEKTAFEYFLEGESYFGGANGYDLAAARRAYEQAARLDPQVHQSLWYQAGRVDFLTGRFNGAIQKFNRQYEYYENDVLPVHYMLGLTYGYRARQTDSEYDWERAAEGFETFLSFQPESSWARTDLAWVYFAQGKYEDMKPVLEVGLQDTPDHPWLLNMYGLALLNTDERTRANEYFVHAARAAERLTIEQWGNAYPGNNPESWQKGLDEMRAAIAHNVAISQD